KTKGFAQYSLVGEPRANGREHARPTEGNSMARSMQPPYPPQSAKRPSSDVDAGGHRKEEGPDADRPGAVVHRLGRLGAAFDFDRLVVPQPTDSERPAPRDARSEPDRGQRIEADLPTSALFVRRGGRRVWLARDVGRDRAVSEELRFDGGWDQMRVVRVGSHRSRRRGAGLAGAIARGTRRNPHRVDRDADGERHRFAELGAVARRRFDGARRGAIARGIVDANLALETAGHARDRDGH